MASYKTNRIIPIALVLIIAAIAIAALVSLTRFIFFSGTSTSTATNVDTSESALLSTTADRMVRMTVRGPIVANESFHSYQITVTPNSRNLTTYTSYLDQQIDTANLDNNIPAYDQFVHALDHANLAKGTQLTGTSDDIRGVCATGLVYKFEILQNNNVIKELWTSTCGGSRGSLDANVSQLTNLFTAQIPRADVLISKLDL